MSWFDRIVLSTLSYVPRPMMRRLSDRYIAGETLEEAMGRLGSLCGRGYSGILNILGEYVKSEAEAKDVVEQFRAAARAVAKAGHECTISVKPTHLGLTISEDTALANYRALAETCGELGLFLRVEMEDHPTTDATLRIFEVLRKEHERVGIVLQSRLLRTPADIDALAEGPLDVRMVKGIYLEPPEVAHTDRDAISRAFVECTRQLLDRGARVAFATHDEPLGAELVNLVRQREMGTDDYEFQVLMGVQERLWSRWKSEGHNVRVYVPYGPEWRAYSLRRLSKNPQILRHVIRDTLRFGR